MADVTRWEREPGAVTWGYELREKDDGPWVKYTDHLAAVERVRVETLREARKAVLRLPQPWARAYMDTDVLAAIDRLINAATTGDTDD